MDGYDIIWNQLKELWKKYPHLESCGQWYVKIQYKYDWEDTYSTEWTFMQHYYSYDGEEWYITENDWNEGQTDCKLLAVFDEQEEKLIWRNEDE